RAGLERAPRLAQERDELARQHVLGEVPRVKAVDGSIGLRAEVVERVALGRLEAALGGLRDHPRIEVDAIRPDPVLAHELEERAASRAEVDDAPAALDELDELLGLAADDRLVAAEARLEVHRVEVRCEVVLAPLRELALEALQARVEPRRRPVAQVGDRARRELVDALLALAQRRRPPAQEPDDRPAREGDERADERLAAGRVVADLLAERLSERGDRVRELLGEERPPARQRQRERGFDLGTVRPALAALAHALADFCHDRVDVDRPLVHRSESAARSRSRRSITLSTRYALETTSPEHSAATRT